VPDHGGNAPPSAFLTGLWEAQFPAAARITRAHHLFTANSTDCRNKFNVALRYCHLPLDDASRPVVAAPSTR